MKGTIRFLAGLLITFGAVGGLETSENLWASVGLCVLGLAIMYSGTRAMSKNDTIFY